MSPETYWLVAPWVLIGLSGFGWLALWLTRPRDKTQAERPKVPAAH
ncbi:MAG: hypothetical protein JOY71_13760 [Acetobacteraceae bacterium]|nr:hypothetical protein [Acetobacteraceae bacterium]MBV8523168.1 hypothetical protein [Acetobacteraceae bacterium]